MPLSRFAVLFPEVGPTAEAKSAVRRRHRVNLSVRQPFLPQPDGAILNLNAVPLLRGAIKPAPAPAPAANGANGATAAGLSRFERAARSRHQHSDDRTSVLMSECGLPNDYRGGD